MPRHRYLIAYDIADDKRRTRVSTILGDHGDRLQWSVFRCDLNEREHIMLVGLLAGSMHATEDQVLLVKLGPVNGAAAEHLQALGRPCVPDRRVRIV